MTKTCKTCKHWDEDGTPYGYGLCDHLADEPGDVLTHRGFSCPAYGPNKVNAVCGSCKHYKVGGMDGVIGWCDLKTVSANYNTFSFDTCDKHETA